MTLTGRLYMQSELTSSIRYWLDRVLSCLGIPHAERQECIARGSVALGDVMLLFLEPSYGERSFLLVRALADEMPPAGQCEALFQMALEVQGSFCGPHVPMLCLDWPSRVLMVSSQLDVTRLAADDAAQVLLGLREMALQWRTAIAEHRAAADPSVSTAPLQPAA